MLQNKSVFWMLFFFILMQPYLQGGNFQLIAIFIYALYFLGTKQAIKILNDNDIFWRAHFTSQKAQKKFYLKGEEIFEQGEDKEANYIDQMGIKKRSFRLLASLMIVLTPPVFIMLNLLPKDFFFNGAHIVFYIFLLAMVNSSYQGHLIVIGSLALLSSLFFTKWSYFQSVPLLVFCFLFMVSLSNKIIREGDHSRFQFLSLAEVFKTSVIYILTAFIIQMAMPEKLDWLKAKKVLAEKIKVPTNIPKAPIKSLDYIKNKEISLDKLDRVIESLNGLELNLEKIPSIPLNLKADMKGLRIEALDIKNKLKNPNLTPAQMNSLADRLKKLNLKIKTSQESFQKYQDQLIDNAEKFPSLVYEQTKKGINDFNIEDKFNDIPKVDFKPLQDSLKVEANKTEKYLEKLEENKHKEQFEFKKIQDKKEQQEKAIEYGKILSRVIVSFLFFIIFLLILRRKKKLKKVLQDDKVMNEIKNAYRKLKRMKLSPEEEVIHKYNFIKDSLKKLYFEEKEVPPPMITHDFLSSNFPRLNKVSFHFNDIFSHCFYNESAVSKKQLSMFRKSFNAILNTLIK